MPWIIKSEEEQRNGNEKQNKVSEHKRMKLECPR